MRSLSLGELLARFYSFSGKSRFILLAASAMLLTSWFFLWMAIANLLK